MSALLNLAMAGQKAHNAVLQARQKVADTCLATIVSDLIAGALQEIGHDSIGEDDRLIERRYSGTR